jgi:hypothetical protein
VLKECGHTSTTGSNQTLCLPVVEKAVRLFKPELAVKVRVLSVGTERLHDPSYRCFTKLVKVLRNLEPKLFTDERVDRNMDLFVS